MEVVRILVGVVLPYVAIAVFFVGMIYRIYRWKKLKSPPMTLFPAPAAGGRNAINVIQEAFLFKSLFRGDRLLWVLAWLFHVVLALIFLGHLRVITNVDQLLMKLGMSEDGISVMSSSAGGAAGVVILITTIFLFIRRLFVPRVREITGLGDYLALILVAVILITGNMMRFGGEHFDLTGARSYFAGLASFSNVGGAPVLVNNLFLAHMCLAFLLLMYIPFSKILHFGGIFFTHQLIRKH